MKVPPVHPWDVSPAAARQIQDELRQQVLVRPLPAELRTVAGADISYNRGSDRLYAALVVFDLQARCLVEIASAVVTVTFPYVPGLLSFREGPAVLAAWERLRTRPDAIIFDGQGIAHPRRCGLAAHMGVLLDMPSVGCAKSRLIGTYAEPGREPGAWEPLSDGAETIGAVLRTRREVKPVFVSVGHRADLSGAVDLVLRCTVGYRLPEPTRLAHQVVNKLRLGEL